MREDLHEKRARALVYAQAELRAAAKDFIERPNSYNDEQLIRCAFEVVRKSRTVSRGERRR